MNLNANLGDLVSIRGGGTPDRKNLAYWNGSVPWASVKDIADFRLSKTEEFITQDGVDNSATSIIPKETIIVVTRMAVGRACITDFPVAINQDLKALFCSPKLLPKYLLWFLISASNKLNEKASGATVKGIKIDALKDLKIPHPPLEEQKRIAAILDKADAIRRKRKEAIALTEELLRSTFLDMFGDPVTNPKRWEKLSLGELVPQKGQIVDGPFGSSLKPECYVADGVRVVRNFNIQDDFFDESEFKFVTEEKFSEIQRSNVKYKDLLLSTKGTIGNVCIMPKLDGKSVLSASGTVRIRLPETSRVSPEFVVQQMIQKNYKQYMKWFEAGTNQKYLNLSGIRKMELIVPPLELQQKFLNLRIKNYSLKSRSNSTFVETDNLFNSLLQKAFRGEL